jgi:hypothetical protein
MIRTHLRSAALATVALAAPVCVGQTPPNYGIDFVTVGSPGNRPYDGPDPNGNTIGRGSVPYAFRIGRTEITTSQYLEFINTFATSETPPAHFDQFGPVHWGAHVDPTYSGPGLRFALNAAPSAGMYPVGGIGWFDAALYCNWLQNGKQSSPASLLTGAYDTSLWSIPWVPGGPNVSWSRTSSAQYWIPTLDESLKAAHYDPNRNGPGQDGWWLYKNSSDQPGTPGPPGVGTTSAGYSLPNWGEWSIPLGAYPQSLSPWGLLDTSGGATEWTESINNPAGGRRNFFYAGSYAGQENIELWDAIYGVGGAGPGGTGGIDGAFRIASAVPLPASLMPFCIGALVLIHRKRKGQSCLFGDGPGTLPPP